MAFSRRHRRPELMDQPHLDPREHLEALDGLRRINQLSRSSAILWQGIRPLAAQASGKTLKVLDVACGGGDVAIALARRARRAGIRLGIEGCDVSPTALQVAGERSQAEGVQDVNFFRIDVSSEALPKGYDVVMCSLFLHHRSDEEAVELLRKMADAARLLVLVNDLRRSRGAYYLAWLGCRLLTRSPVVRVDGPLSVEAAFTMDEALELARAAGLKGASISRHWPFRFLLRWRRP